MRREIITGAIIILVIIPGCLGMNTNQSQPQSQSTNEENYENSNLTKVADENVSQGVHRFVDEKAGVVCYIYRDDAVERLSGGTGGLSCIPINDTKLTLNSTD